MFITTSTCIVFFNLIVLSSFIEEGLLLKLFVQSDDEMGRTCGTCGKEGNEYRVVERKPEGKRPRTRPRRRWAMILR